ncbi:MAG: hypothetical protein M3460_31185 [Actinomycetota bacterium]|nr:hypothetical protein [Actinomycetota bacterium]
MSSVTITRRKDLLEGQRVAVLRRWRRKHGGMDLLVVLPNGRKRLIPQAWTDADPTKAGMDADAEGLAATLGTVEDLLAAVVLVSALGSGVCGEQAASQSTCEEDHDAACPAQCAPDPVPDTTAGRVGRASRSRRDRGGLAVGTPDRQGGRRGRGERR